MKILLDTNVVLRMAGAPESLNKKLVDVLTKPATKRIVSAAAVWEMAVKWRLGKLTLPQHPRVWFTRAIRELGLDLLPIRHDHAERVADLPDHHRDPFDRILIAQAEAENIPLATSDSKFEKYAIKTIKA